MERLIGFIDRLSSPMPIINRSELRKTQEQVRKKEIERLANEARMYDKEGFAGTPLALYSPKSYEGMDIREIEIFAEGFTSYHYRDLQDLETILEEASSLLVDTPIRIEKSPIDEGNMGAIAWHSVNSNKQEKYWQSVRNFQGVYGPFGPIFLKEHQQETLSKQSR